MSVPPTFALGRIGDGLPFAAAVAALESALAARGAAVVQAPPGTGKTTLVPPVVVDHLDARGVSTPPGRVVVTQPRRVAVRAAARRLAHLTGTEVGDLVGFTVRGERRVGPRTRIEMVTPGVLLRRLLSDPELPGTSAVVLDEVHERSLDTDLLIGILGEVRALREDLVLVAMSATVDAPAFAALIGGEDGPAPVVEQPAALHPLEVRWAPAAGPRLDTRGVSGAFLDHVAAQTVDAHRAALARDASVDALVFLPGVREVEHVVAQVARLAPHTEVLALHGRVGPREQDRATAGRAVGDRPRVVVSTSLAESSLTVPGVRLVVDSGLAREPRRDAARDMSGLVTVPVSRAGAEQRAGRAARLGPGVVVRCYDARTWNGMPAHAAPEITTSDLTEAALLLACWGSPEGRGLALPTPPPAAAMADAVATLHGLGALEADGRATALGRRLATIPADPRLGRALVDGSAAVGSRVAAEVVAALAGDLRAEGADLPRLLAQLRSGGGGGAGAARRGDSTGAGPGSAGTGSARWAEEVRRLQWLLPPAVPAAPATGHGDAEGLVIALAHPGRIARLVDATTYLLASGTRAALPRGSSLTGHPWLAVADVARAEGAAAAGTGAIIRAAAPLSEADARQAGAHLLTTTLTATFAGGRLSAREVRALGAITLSSTPVKASGEAGRAAVRAALATAGVGSLHWSEGATTLRRRLAFLHHHLGAPWPDVSDAALLNRVEAWLGPELERLASGTPAERIDLHEPLRRLLPWPEAARLDELAPERLRVPSGSHVRITYPPVDTPQERPLVAVKLQECFGWAQTPRLADGRVPVLFHLLSPAQRPLAVTDDLASFWHGPYAQVRAEMRGRYPKHPWPEDPWTAPATARTNRRS